MLFFGALLISCQPKEEVDLVIYNANVYTVDGNFSKATSIAVKDGVFTEVSTSDLTPKYEAKKTVDAQGKTIVPGLIDAHCHFYELGLNQQVVDLVGTGSYQEILDALKAFQEKNQVNFIRGRGWDQNDWEVKEFPTKKELDEMFPNTPVALERVDGHAYLVNQKALDMAGITQDTSVEGGEIVKKEGNIIGVLVDAPMEMINAVMPKPNRAIQIQALKDAERLCLDYGLTTVNDAGLDRSVIELVDSLQQAGELSIRMYAMVSNTEENLDYFLSKGIVKTEN